MRVVRPDPEPTLEKKKGPDLTLKETGSGFNLDLFVLFPVFNTLFFYESEISVSEGGGGLTA